MEKWSMVLMLLFLNNLSPSYAIPFVNPDEDPVGNPVPVPDMVIQISQMVGSGSDESQVLEENDEHIEEDCNHWSYPSTNWPSICSQYCSGSSQSPIDIVTTPPLPKLNFSPTLSFKYDSVPLPYTNIKNNGHSVVVTSEGKRPEWYGGGLNGNYTLAQLHFHWGCENSQGSEHTVDGQSYPMELHLVHYKTCYGSLGEAIKKSDGLAVMAVFFTNGTENDAIKPITDNILRVTVPGTTADIPYNNDYTTFLPTSGPPEYYIYKGSLTTPTCNEVVNWIVFKSINQLSQAQLDAFRTVQDHDGNPLCNNHREVQPINGRTVGLGSVIPLTYYS